MGATQIAERLFNRAFHSEADRQARIDRTASEIAQSITACLLQQDDIALEVAGEILDHLEPETIKQLVRFALRGDIAGASLSRQLLLNEADQAVQRVAEYRAIKEVDAMTPEDFLPD